MPPTTVWPDQPNLSYVARDQRNRDTKDAIINLLVLGFIYIVQNGIGVIRIKFYGLICKCHISVSRLKQSTQTTFTNR